MDKTNMISRVFLSVVISLFLIQTVHAFDFNVGSISGPLNNPYQGEDGEFRAVLTASSDNICKLTCTYTTNSDSGQIGTDIEKGQPKNFGFKIRASGSSGQASESLKVTCSSQREGLCLITGDKSDMQTITFGFQFNGDNICTTRSDFETCVNAKSDCPCDNLKSCIDDKGDPSRTKDTKQCTTYCGNGVIEKDYEKCYGNNDPKSCLDDVGKCDGQSCSSKSECEGKYCVHNTCSHLPYVVGDTFCDVEVGENCKNSAADCACLTNERCSATTNKCETYCGNSICEASEQGVCKADCKWCGDGSCDASQKESCKSCESDCGVCENKKANEEIQQKTQEVVQKGLESSAEKQKTIIYVTLGIIAVIVVGYLAFKFLKKPKHAKKTKKK